MAFFIILLFVGLALIAYSFYASSQASKSRGETIERRKKYVESISPTARIIVNNGIHLFFKDDDQQVFGIDETGKTYSFSGLYNVSYYDDGIRFMHNDSVKKILSPQGWESVTTYYYVTSDISTAREIAGIRDKEEQKRIIKTNNQEPFLTNNQVDFVKNRVAIEVQFGKYFSVAYDLHVKHTFFFLRNDIDVGIEIIPTKAMCVKMDSGVPWYENELANIIREGRSNPTVPIVMIGIEPEEILI